MSNVDMTGLRNGTWCKKLFSGIYADLLNPTPGMISVVDISTSLHNQCRYTGHVQFYSVAEHCILAAALAGDDGRSEREQLAVLLHDAAEAYLGDVSRPLKLYLRSAGVTIYDELSDRWDEAIGLRFGVDLKEHHNVIKHYDNIMLKAEKKRFWPHDFEEWQGLDVVPDRNVKWLSLPPSSSLFECDLTNSLLTP